MRMGHKIFKKFPAELYDVSGLKNIVAISNNDNFK